MKHSQSVMSAHYNNVVLLSSVYISLFFLVRSVITRTPGSPQGDPVILRNGQTAEIRFNIAANPPPSPSSFRWFKDGELTNSSNGLMLSQDAFIVNPAREEHNGTYSLEVTNIAGPSFYNFTLIIQCK